LIARSWGRVPSRREVLFAGAGGLLAASIGAGASAGETVAREDLAEVFQQMGLVGTFAALDVAADRLTLVNAERAEVRFVPASIFKIPNTLIALETGALKDADEMFRYDGNPRLVKAWERDMTLREAITVSNVPVYQKLARRIGLANYRVWLDRLHYGNRETAAALERFWLDGPLAISAVEQARFLGLLAQGRLSASARSQAIVRDIIRIEEKGGRLLFAKTGWSGKIGWWTGWIEHGDRITAFALNIDMTAAAEAPKRIELGEALLARLGVY
jgi:beta-lactamase class D